MAGVIAVCIIAFAVIFVAVVAVSDFLDKRGRVRRSQTSLEDQRRELFAEMERKRTDAQRSTAREDDGE